ncbi:MAG: histidine phosphatase family protein [Chlamydiales bacterium]|nr:histidine phosphatase family protein [Chlamydiales bacterium]
MKYVTFLLFVLLTPLQAKEVSFFLVRHGETEWNRLKRVQGHTDMPLNNTGRAQAREAAEKLVQAHLDITSVYASDLSRAQETAKETATKLNVPIFSSKALRERCAGISEGFTYDEWFAHYKDAFDRLEKEFSCREERWAQRVVPESETLAESYARMKEELTRIANASFDGEKVAVFAHKRVITVFAAGISGQEYEAINVPNCGMLEVHYNSETTPPFHLVTKSSQSQQ